MSVLLAVKSQGFDLGKRIWNTASFLPSCSEVPFSPQKNDAGRGATQKHCGIEQGLSGFVRPNGWLMSASLFSRQNHILSHINLGDQEGKNLCAAYS